MIKNAEILQDIKKTVDGFATAFIPCPLCGHQDKAKKENLEKCLKCCYYYPSNFDPKKVCQKSPKSRMR